MDKITTKPDKETSDAVILYDEEPTLAFDVAQEMGKGYDIIKDVVEKLIKDTRVEELRDDDGSKVGQRTHVNPQLLPWVREARLLQNDIWKLTGGELQQEAEKKILETKAQIILEIMKQKPETYEEALENWKTQRKK